MCGTCQWRRASWRCFEIIYGWLLLGFVVSSSLDCVRREIEKQRKKQSEGERACTSLRLLLLGESIIFRHVWLLFRKVIARTVCVIVYQRASSVTPFKLKLNRAVRVKITWSRVGLWKEKDSGTNLHTKPLIFTLLGFLPSNTEYVYLYGFEYAH